MEFESFYSHHKITGQFDCKLQEIKPSPPPPPSLSGATSRQNCKVSRCILSFPHSVKLLLCSWISLLLMILFRRQRVPEGHVTRSFNTQGLPNERLAFSLGTADLMQYSGTLCPEKNEARMGEQLKVVNCVRSSEARLYSGRLCSHSCPTSCSSA